MIKIYLGNVGSGKTLSAVKDIYDSPHKTIYSNIKTKLKNQINLSHDMIINKEQIGAKRDGTPTYEYKLNSEFWKNVKKPVDVILDEAHSIINSRRSMSKINIIVSDWIALVRRVLGDTTGQGNLVFITQLPGRIDIIAREMATHVRYHIHHYVKTCLKCGLCWYEHSDMPELYESCRRCGHYRLVTSRNQIEVYKFQSMKHYMFWEEMNRQTYYSRFYLTKINKFFPLYDTLQWDNLFSEYY